MNKLKHISFGLCTLLTTQEILALTQKNLSYTIRKGDTLSTVLAGLGVCPLWGKKSSVKAAYELNPGKIKNNGNFILPKNKIILPIENLSANEDYEISENHEVSFTVPHAENKCTLAYKQRLARKQEIRSVAEEKMSEAATDTKPTLSVNPVNVENTPTDAFGTLRVTTDFFYTAMNMTDKSTLEKAEVLSRVNRAYQFNWEQNWDHNHKTFLSYRTEEHTYEAIENKLPEKSYNLQGFGFGYERKLSDRFNMRLTARVQESLFMRATTLTNLQLERAMIPQVSLMPIYRLYSRGPFNLYADLGLNYLLSSKTSQYDIKSGYGYLAGLSLTQKIKDFELMGRTYYGGETQDSSIMEKSTRVFGITLGVAWNFGH